MSREGVPVNNNRAPKRGEVWTLEGKPRNVVAVDGEVVVLLGDHGEFILSGLHVFECGFYDPPVAALSIPKQGDPQT